MDSTLFSNAAAAVNPKVYAEFFFFSDEMIIKWSLRVLLGSNASIDFFLRHDFFLNCNNLQLKQTKRNILHVKEVENKDSQQSES